MLIGTNPAIEAPVLNARIRKAWSRGANIGPVGPAVDLTYEHAHLGDGPSVLADLLKRDTPSGDKPSLVIVGMGALAAKTVPRFWPQRWPWPKQRNRA